MKLFKLRIILFISSFFLTNTTHAQCKVSGELQNYKGDNILKIAKPLNGFANRVVFADSSAKVNDGKFEITIDCTKPVITAISFSGFIVYLMIRPNDSIHVALRFPTGNLHERVQCEFSGSNAVAQRLYFDYEYFPATKYEKVFQLLKEWRTTNLTAGIQTEIARQSAPFDSLFHKERFTEDCYYLVKSSITATLLDMAIRKIADNKYSTLKMPDPLRTKIADSLFSLFSPLDEHNFYGIGSFSYIDTYFSFLRSKRSNTGSIYIQADTTIEYHGKLYEITGPFVPLLEIDDDRLREYCYAHRLLDCISVGAQETLKGEMAYLKDRYPQSAYFPIIEKYKEEKANRIQVLGRSKNHGQADFFEKWQPEIIDSAGEIQELRLDKIALLKEKLVFVDIWATWCGPCMEEMKYNYRLDSFLHANNIARLYISLDNPTEISKWRSVIYKFHLGGYHVLAGEKLKQSILTKLETKENVMAIPRYLVVKDADILDFDAFRPSDFQRLKDKLEKIIHL